MSARRGVLDRFDSFMRRTFPPSVDVFADRLDRLEAKVDALASIPLRRQSQSAVRLALKQLCPVAISGHEKRRFGSLGDGGYIMVDDFEDVKDAFSFGIDVNDDWDLCLATKGIRVHQFDHSIPHAPSTHPLLVFHQKKIGVQDDASVASLPGLLSAVEGDVVLKMDIEGAEWDVLSATPSDQLARCAQICCEFHGLSALAENEFLARALSIWTKLKETHAVVHVHANNCAPLVNVANIPLPDVLEVTFASRARYAFSPNQDTFPTMLDAPNRSEVPDIFLGRFEF